MSEKNKKINLSYEFFDQQTPPTLENYKQLISYRENGKLPADTNKQIENFKDKIIRLPLTLEFMWAQDNPSSEKKLIGYMMSKTTTLLNNHWLENLLKKRNSGTTAHEMSKIIKSNNQYDLNWDKLNRFSFEAEAYGTGVVSLVNIEVARSFSGFGLSAGLVKKMLARAYDNFNIQFAIAYSRAPQYDGSDLQEYVELQRDSDQCHPDWGIRFHQKAGGEVICGVENCAENDPQSNNNGSFVIYNLTKLRNRDKI